MPEPTAPNHRPVPSLADPQLRTAREDARGNLVGFYHREAPGGPLVAWSALGSGGAIAEWGWLVPGTTQAETDSGGEPIAFPLDGRDSPQQPAARRRWPIVAGIAGALAAVAVFAVAGAASDVAEAPAAQEPPVGQLIGGGVLDFADLADRDAVVFIYAPWCPYCAASMPDLVAAAGEHGGEVEFVTVGGQADQADVEEYIGKHGIAELANVYDGDGGIARHFGQRGVPVWLFLNDDGTRWTLVGVQPEGEIDRNMAQLIQT